MTISIYLTMFSIPYINNGGVAIMFHKEYLKIYEGCSKEFDEFLYWCISENKQPSFARAGNDVPYKELYLNLNDDEKKLAQKLVRERLANSDDIFYPEFLGYFGDNTDIPLLKEKLRVYKEKNKDKNCDFTYCIKACKKIINALKRC